VRPTYLKLIYKCKGADRIALVSDCCAGGDTMGSDVNVIDGVLYGSQLTLSVAIRNMRKHTGAPICDLIKMVTSTPAKAVGLFRDRGSIEPGKQADLVLWNAPDLDYLGYRMGSNLVNTVIKNGNIAHH
jgi:imidazolonepropionase